MSVVKSTALFVRFPVTGQQFFEGQVPGLGYDHIDGFPAERFKRIMPAQLCHIQLFVKNKIHIPSVCNHLCHGDLLG